MDDDIDIEEHDLLDNPRIKSIFPDLSRVKIEIPDEEDIVDEYFIEEDFIDEGHDEEETQEQEPQEMQHQYEYSIETTTDDAPGERAPQETDTQDDIEDFEEDMYFYNTEIILGTKPTTDLEVLYEEAQTSTPTVVLENWDDILKSSPCFCNTCLILFPTVNALDAHKMISHSYLVAMESPQKNNTARKSTVTSKFCHHCSKTFPDDTSLIKHLYKLVPGDKYDQVNNEIPVPEKKGKIVPPLRALHKKIKSSTHVVAKIQTKKLKSEPKETDEPALKNVTKYKLNENYLSRDGKFFASSSLVPKSTLFQCNVCQIAFLSCFGVSQHAKYCKKVLSFERCGICKRKIKSKDVKIHELQHTYNDKLKIYTITKTLYERLLCKCPKCSACFDELGFWAHYPKCKKSEKLYIRCSDCDINMSSTRYKRHRLKHLTKKLTKKDFIILEFYDQNNMSMIAENRAETLKIQKRERERMYREKQRKKASLNVSKDKDGDITLYYCEFCGCCQYILNYKGHSGGSCEGSATKKYCDKCGLCFTPKSIESHLVLHEKRSFSLKDINIVSLTTGKPIDPPMSKFVECDTCFKNFLCRRTMHGHDCKTEKFVTCKICTKKYNLEAFKIHKLFHSVEKLMRAELMKKYERMNSMWNVMYMCVSCELVTMTYDAAVTHSQGHLNYIISDLHKQCVVCDLRIAQKEFGLHEKLHTNNVSIERESFKILKYNHEHLFTKEWLMLFQDLPKEHRQQILSKSIYRYTRSVKMHIEMSARSDDVKYFCLNCNNFVEGINIRLHVRAKCSRNTKYVCGLCHEVFKTLKQFLSHDGSHEGVPKRRTIITFNNECDRDFNNHLCLIESKARKSSNIPLSRLRDILLSDNVKASYKLYKCVKCEMCVTLKGSMRRHRCVTGNLRRFCGICEQYFCAKKTSLHLEAHRKKPQITKDSFHLIPFNGPKIPKLSSKNTPKRSAKKEEVAPKQEAFAKVSPKKLVIAKIFKCQCGLHFTSLKTVEKHLEKCSPEHEISKETCSKCKLLFPTEVLVTHLINHHHKETKIIIENIGKTNLYKCADCSIFFISMVNFNAHVETCGSKNGTRCKSCGYIFGRKCAMKHLCSSEETTYINKITVVRKKVVKEGTVFKCLTCDICYLQRNSFKYHSFEVKHSLKKPPSVCEICGLRFTSCSLRKHMIIHSFLNEDFNIKVIDPVNGGSHFVTGSNSSIKDNSTPSSRRLSHRKRKIIEDMEEMDRVIEKKPKRRHESTIDTSLSERKSPKKPINKPSTSRDSVIDLTTLNTPYEIIVPDEISNHNHQNVIDIDNASADITSPERKVSLDKNGLSTKLKSRIVVKGYSKNLFKCVLCKLHYMKESSFDYHVKTNRLHDTSENQKCDVCDLEFSKYTLPRHKYVHHERMRLKKEDFIIQTETTHSKEDMILKAKIDTIIDTIIETIDIDDDTVSVNDSVSEIKSFSDVNISDVCDLSDIVDNVCETLKIYYYKCADCNVCFVEQKLCFEHTLKHETLNPRTYIQCKICNFQFLIDSLKEHMDVHHSTDFKIESLTIYEYKALGIGLDPKIDVYQAVDKVQSRLVSTTTDLDVV